MQKLHLFVLSCVAAMSLTVLGCAEDDDGGGDGDGGNNSGAVTDACYAQCDAQEAGGCGIGQQTCEDACDAIIAALDEDCQAKAQASYECNVANDEVCTVNAECETETMEYADCLSNAG